MSSPNIPAPADREIKTRAASRVVVISDADEVLLFVDSDPGYPGVSWWVTPGGGIDPGETEAQAAVRELREETGCQITEADLIGPIARRRVAHGYSDQILVQNEAFFAVRVPRFEVDISEHTEDEQLTLTGHRWWPRTELAQTDAWIWPDCLAELTAASLSPDPECRELGAMEESTLPVAGPATVDRR